MIQTLGLALLAAPVMAGEPKKKGGGDGYTQFRTLSVFTQANSMHHGTLSVDMGLYTSDPKFSDTIKLYVPRLTAAYAACLQAYAVNLNTRSLVDIDYISAQLQEATDTTLGRKGAKVLLGAILLN